MSSIRRMWKNEYFKTAVAIALIIGVVFGLMVGLGQVLHTSSPALVVESGSMSIPYDGSDNFWLSIAHPFDRTLSVGDIIIIQGVNPSNLNANYPNSDLIVYRNPSDPSGTPIVHRIVSKQEINCTWYFQTKGDGNGQQWPAIPSPDEYDSHTIWYNAQYSNTGIPQNYVIGKVVMRIPWLGWVTLFMKGDSWGLPVVITIIMLLVVVEFVVPELRKKRPEQQKQT